MDSVDGVLLFLRGTGHIGNPFLPVGNFAAGYNFPISSLPHPLVPVFLKCFFLKLGGLGLKGPSGIPPALLVEILLYLSFAKSFLKMDEARSTAMGYYRFIWASIMGGIKVVMFGCIWIYW